MKIPCGVARLIGTALLLITVGVIAKPASADAATFRVRCETDNLQTAIDNAVPGQKLRVSGECDGNFTISKNIELLGKPAATLRSVDGTVLTIRSGANLKLVDITVTGGVGNDTMPAETRVGGVLNEGTLTLHGTSSIRENVGRRCIGSCSGQGVGGLINLGHATLNNESAISHNSGSTGGVRNIGTLVLNDRASVNENVASGNGGISNLGNIVMNHRAEVSANFGSGTGGVSNGTTGERDASLTLNNRASIWGNRSSKGTGGGINNYGTVYMSDRSTINTNESYLVGGGILNFGSLTLADHASIHDNTGSAGGGVANFGLLTLLGRYSIRNNVGGGIFYNRQTRAIVGSVSGVRANTPYNCFVPYSGELC